MQCFLCEEERDGMRRMSSGKWSMLCRKTGLGEGTEGQMERGSIFFISYLNSNIETFSLGSVGIPHPCTAFKVNVEENYCLVVVVIVAH